MVSKFTKDPYQVDVPQTLENTIGLLKWINDRVEYDLNDIASKFFGILGIGSIVVAMYLFAPNFTGNVIANLEVGRTNLFGLGLLLIGLVGVFVSVKKSR